MLPKPLAETPTIEWLRYMHTHNQRRGESPLPSADITRLFAYIQVLEGRLAHAGADVPALRNTLGLGVGRKGKGFPGREAVRAELARIEEDYHRKRRTAQRVGARGTLPLYTARFERADRWYIATVDEIPGVFGQGRTLHAAVQSLAGAVQLAIETSRSSRKATAKKPSRRQKHVTQHR